MADISKIQVPIDGVMTELNIKGSGGSGLPDEVITYQQFLAKTDQEQAAYTGYVTGWPGSGGGTGALSGLTDVNLTNPSDGDILVYDGTSGKWENKNLDKGSVSVTSDGVKTFAQVLNSLFSLIDMDKISNDSNLIISGNIYSLSHMETTQLTFFNVTLSTNSLTVAQYLLSASNSSVFIRQNNDNPVDRSSNVVASFNKFEIIY